jgi:hypothetical protein
MGHLSECVRLLIVGNATGEGPCTERTLSRNVIALADMVK